MLIRQMLVACLLFLPLPAAPASQSDAILQYFGTSWNDIAHKMPELAEAGYTALWLPPPFKGTGALDVGFGTHDRFDLGDKDQMGTVRTKYGTAAELANLVEVAHRFGIRLYFDNVMAHNGGPIPGYDTNTSIYAQPGFVPEDFHLRVTSEGFYRNWPGIDWQKNDLFQLLNRNPFGVDIAHESPNTSFGANEDDDFPKYVGVRHPNNRDYYPDLDLPIVVTTPGGNVTIHPFADKEPFEDLGWGPDKTGAENGRFDWQDANGNGQHDAGEVAEPFSDLGVDGLNPARRTALWGFGDGRYNMGDPVPEDVNAMLIRALRWFTDRYQPDGFRLDAVKHVPDYFFGLQSGAKDSSNAGYLGAANMQYNLTRGFTDWDNHRDTSFSDNPRNDLFLYGEHLGAPPAEGPYLAAGMRIANDNFLNSLKDDKLPWNFAGLDQPGFGMYGGTATGMKYPMSHDNNYLWDGHKELATVVTYLTEGPGILYTDGYNQAGPPDWFPKPAYLPFLGQFGSRYALNVLSIHRNFARGWQVGRWSDRDFAAFERRDKSDNWGMSDADGTVLLVMMGRYGTGGQTRDFSTTFPVGARLKNYSYHGGPFYANVAANGRLRDDAGNPIIVDGGKYFAFSFDNPGMPGVWGEGPAASVKPVTILQNGQPAGTMTYTRRDGRDGDPDFNPPGLPGDQPGDYRYDVTIPRVTDGRNLTFLARADGSAENILLKLDGGVDLNAHLNLGAGGADRRDNKPGVATDVYLGYEQMRYVQRAAEKFAARNVSRNVVGSPGSETYIATIGTAGFIVNNGAGPGTASSGAVTWAYHDPADQNQAASPVAQFFPAPQSAAGQPLQLFVKIGYSGQPYRAFVYYTTDGATFPEGSAGTAAGNTLVVPMAFSHNAPADGAGTPVWWKATLPALPAGTVLRYKIGVHRQDAPSVFPSDATAITLKRRMETLFEIPGFDATQAKVRPHNDYGPELTGLAEGFHVLRVRPFLKRDGRAAIYNTFVQPFYYDTRPPAGEIRFPSRDGETLGGGSYGVVVRADHSTTEVWYRIVDSEPGNDDQATGGSNGNGAWTRAAKVTPTVGVASSLPQEWRFDYVNIPPSGNATLEVRFKELTSAADNSLSDSAGHFLTLTRTVATRGEAGRLFVRWPQADGDLAGPGYVLKAQFSKSLAANLSPADLLARFRVEINGVVQPAAANAIIYDATPEYHELAVNLPNLYDGNPETLHDIRIFHARPAPQVTLQARRLVTAPPGPVAVRVEFLDPPAYQGVNGIVQPLVLPAKADPQPADRRYTVRLETAAAVQSLQVFLEQGGGVLTPAGPPSSGGESKLWSFVWEGMTAGPVRLRAVADTDGVAATAEGGALRETMVVFRQVTAADPADADDDDDGLPDDLEAVAPSYPSGNSDTWTNGDVHVVRVGGRSFPLSPDTDGDGLPDGLESGWRSAGAQTSLTADTDGDGVANFQPDLDPPFYNTLDNAGTVPNVDPAGISWRRADQRGGSTTDPANPDSDADGLPDGVEDLNRNGWVDGDGDSLSPSGGVPAARKWPDGVMDPGERWTETDPGRGDSDGDGLLDGFGEDTNLDGLIAGDTNRNRRHDNGEAWSETDPLQRDTDGDGLPDGWEVQNGLDPLNQGSDNLRTAVLADGEARHGAAGDPDADGVTNLQEFLSGTNPQRAESGSGTPSGGITIGPLPAAQQTSVGSVVNTGEFTDWTLDDLIALDAFDGDGDNYQGGDVYLRYDGQDTSRDLVAFYARDGGTAAAGGDGMFYFRVDLHDLRAGAAQGSLDVYVVINVGNPGSGGVGEMLLPDEVDVLSLMKWNVVVAAYGNSSLPGRVYVDTNPLVNTTSFQNLADPAFGVQQRGPGVPGGFGAIHASQELDAVEFSISRQALLEAGWAGDPATLRYQVFTTKDGTGNIPAGAGDLPGPDLTDSLRDSGIANDFRGDNNSGTRRQALVNDPVASRLNSWVGLRADNDRGRRAKLISLIHGNQPIRSGDRLQAFINTGNGAGYYRPLDAHQAFDVPLTMHLTATLASALQWAAVDPAAGKPWRDGSALNDRLRGLVSSGRLCLLGSTFSDHILPYFPAAYTADSIGLARQFLSTTYGSPSTRVFWIPERVADHTVLDGVAGLGFSHTFLDQGRHLWKWFGRDAALSNEGYRLNRISGVNVFPLHDQLAAFAMQTTDGGLHTALRQVLSRKARSWQQDQVVTLFADWSDFLDGARAEAYDRNIRWIASRPWIEVLTPEQIAAGEVDLSVPPDGRGDLWATVDRGNGPRSRVAHDYIDYASQENYDHWYFGQAGREEGLAPTVFLSRPGRPLPQAFGTMGQSGVARDSWLRVSSLLAPESALGRLARAVLHSSTFITGFHNQSAPDLRKFSTGAYLAPDTSFNTLADFARISQAQTRHAAVFKEVETWALSAAAGNFDGQAQAAARDLDLDGDPEFLLWNDRVFFLFEALGARLTGGWVRNAATGEVHQAVGNFASYANADTEEEGVGNVAGLTAAAHRTSGFKDWFVVSGASGTNYVNQLYTAEPVPGGGQGWRFASADGRLTKTFTLAAGSPEVRAVYALNGPDTIYVRFGLSPDLYDLLLHGQRHLGPLTFADGLASIVNEAPIGRVRAYVRYAGTGADGTAVPEAIDDARPTVRFDTILMRNQPQTQQVEIRGGRDLVLGLGLEAGPPAGEDADGDGLPDGWERQYGLDPAEAGGRHGGSGDFDGDGLSNLAEFLFGSSPADGASSPLLPAVSAGPEGVTLTFAGRPGRQYRILHAASPAGGWQAASGWLEGREGAIVWTDDGSATGSAPASARSRFYRLEVRPAP